MKKIGSLFVIGLLILTTTIKAGPPEPSTEEYKEAVRKCNKAYEDKKKEVKLCDLALQETKKIKDDANAELKKKDDELNAWYRNPLLWVIVGLIGGVAASK